MQDVVGAGLDYAIEGGLYGPSNLDSCPPEYMPQWAHKLGRGRSACPVRQVVQNGKRDCSTVCPPRCFGDT